MHAALADPDGGLDFAPEPFTPADGDKLYQDMLGQANITFELLRRKQPALAGTTADASRQLMQTEHRATGRFAHCVSIQSLPHGSAITAIIIWDRPDWVRIPLRGILSLMS